MAEERIPTGAIRRTTDYGCCCNDHSCGWTERTDGEQRWIECYFCGEQGELINP